MIFTTANLCCPRRRFENFGLVTRTPSTSAIPAMQGDDVGSTGASWCTFNGMPARYSAQHWTSGAELRRAQSWSSSAELGYSCSVANTPPLYWNDAESEESAELSYSSSVANTPPLYWNDGSAELCDTQNPFVGTCAAITRPVYWNEEYAGWPLAPKCTASSGSLHGRESTNQAMSRSLRRAETRVANSGTWSCRRKVATQHSTQHHAAPSAGQHVFTSIVRPLCRCK